jgi:pyruvate kinase
VWGIEPRLLNFDGRSWELLERANQALLKEGMVDRGETIVVMAGRIPEQPGLSSMMKLHRVGEIEPAGG